MHIWVNNYLSKCFYNAKLIDHEKHIRTTFRGGGDHIIGGIIYHSFNNNKKKDNPVLLIKVSLCRHRFKQGFKRNILIKCH